MKNIHAWVEETKVGNFLVRHRDGSKNANGKVRKFTDYCIERTQTMVVNGKKETGKWLANKLAEQIERRYYAREAGIIDSSEVVNDLIEKFLDDKRADGKASLTVSFYELGLRRFCEANSPKTLTDLMNCDFKKWRAQMKSAGLSNVTIKGRLMSVNVFCQWLIREKKIPTSPIPKKIMPEADPAPPKFYSTAEFLSLDKALAKINHYARIGCRLAHDAGLRKVEIVGDGTERLQGVLWEDLIWHPGGKVDLVVRKEITKGSRRKSAKARRIRLDPDLVLFLGSRSTGPLVPLTRQQFNRCFQKARKMAGINPKLHIHGLRHTFGKNFLQRTGSNQAALRDLMGHTDVKTTQIYSQFEQSYLDECIEKGYEKRKQEEALLNLAGQKDDFLQEIIEPTRTVVHRGEPMVGLKNDTKNQSAS